MPFDPFRGFQAGQQMAGPNAFGVAIQEVMNRIGKLQDLQAESSAKVQAEMGAYKSFLGQGNALGGFQVSKVQAGPFTLENPAYENQQKLAGATATNRAEVLDSAKEGVRTISQMRGMLQINPVTKMVGNRLAISRSGIPGALLSQENPDERDLRSAQGKLHNYIAFARTGRQGLEQAVPYVAEQYNLGYTDPDETVVNRLDAAELELIQRAGLSPEDVEQLRQEGLLNEYKRRGFQ